MKVALFRIWMTTLSFSLMTTIIWGDESIVVEQANQILTTAREDGHKIIGIFPRPIIRSVSGEDSFVGDIEASAVQQLAEFERVLFERGRSFGVQIADPQAVTQALAGIQIPDLGNFDVKKEIAQKTNATALAVMIASESEGGHWKSIFELRNLVTNTADRSQSADFRISLSEAAYMGTSFEVRRWVDGKLVNVGLEGLSDKEAMGVDYNWEVFHFSRLKQHERHPLLDPSLPYGIELIVNGETATPIEVGSDLFVELDTEDKLQLRIVNKLQDKRVVVGLYVDGINSINKVRELPIMTPYQRHWVMESDFVGTINGWLEYDPARNKQTFTQFKLVDAEQSVSALKEAGDVDVTLAKYGTSIHDQIGQITALFYTYGWEGVDWNDEPGPGLRSIDRRIGMGEGNRQDRQLNKVYGERGLLMGAVTLRYVPKGHFNQFLSRPEPVGNGGTQDLGLPEPQKTGGSGKGTTQNSTSKVVVSPIDRGEKPERSSEADPFPDTPKPEPDSSTTTGKGS